MSAPNTCITTITVPIISLNGVSNQDKIIRHYSETQRCNYTFIIYNPRTLFCSIVQNRIDFECKKGHKKITIEYKKLKINFTLTLYARAIYWTHERNIITSTITVELILNILLPVAGKIIIRYTPKKEALNHRRRTAKVIKRNVEKLNFIFRSHSTPNSEYISNFFFLYPTSIIVVVRHARVSVTNTDYFCNIRIILSVYRVRFTKHFESVKNYNVVSDF